MQFQETLRYKFIFSIPQNCYRIHIKKKNFLMLTDIEITLFSVYYLEEN